MKRYCTIIIIAFSFLLQAPFAQASLTIKIPGMPIIYFLNTSARSSPDTSINPKIVDAYAGTLVLLKSDPSLRSELNVSQLKIVAYYDSVYKKNTLFKSNVDRSYKKTPVTSNTSKGGSSESAREDRRRSNMDNMQKFLDIMHSMKPQI